jgi:DNA-binding NtrC family response regulator/tetratricopeptide (TPR) repeat protein
MDRSAPLHRFRTIETLHDGSAGRLDVARDIVEDRHCWVVTPVRPVSAVTETALWLRAASPWAGSRAVEMIDVVRHVDHVHLSLVPVEGRPWTNWFAGASDAEAKRALQGLSGFLREILASGVVAGAVELAALWCGDDGEPFVLPSAWALPPVPDTPGRFRADHIDFRRCAGEVELLWGAVTAFVRESGRGLDTLVAELTPKPEPGPGLPTIVPSIPESGVVHVLCSDRCRSDAATLAQELRAAGKTVLELEPQIRIAREVRLDSPVDALVLCGSGPWADYAVALERLEKVSSLDGSETVYVVTSSPDHEEDMDLWLRGRGGALEPSLVDLGSGDDEGVQVVVPGADHGGRVLEVRAAMERGVVADALTDAFSWQPRTLAESLAGLMDEGIIQVRYALHHAAPGLHLIVQLSEGYAVELDSPRRAEVRALIGSIAERHPDRGRGVGRQWYYACLLAVAGSSGAPERLRRLAHRLEDSGRKLMAVGVYRLLLECAGEGATREDISRSAIVRAQFYQRAGLLEEARRILDEARGRLGEDSRSGHQVDDALAVVTLNRARIDFHVSAFSEGEHRLSVLLEETRGELPVELRSRVYVELAWAQLQLGRTRESVRTSELVLRLLDAHVHAELVARAHTQLGFALYKESDYAGSVMHYDRALRLRKQIGDSLAVARTLNNLGLSYRALEQWNEAEDSLRESLRLKGSSGDEVSLAASLLNLGFLLLDRGQLDEAEDSARQCVDIGQRHRHPETEAEALGLLGEVAWAKGDLSLARRHLSDDLEICERTGHESERLATLRRLAEVLLEAGEFEEAALRLESARGLLSEQPSRLETSLLDRIEADLLSHDELFEPAISAYSAAARGFASIHRPRDQVEALARRGAVEHRLGRVDAARATLGELREIVSRQELHTIPGPARELESLMGAPPSRESRSTAGPRTCLESLVSALEGDRSPQSLVDAISELFDGVDVYWFTGEGEVAASSGVGVRPPDFLRPLATQADGVELKDGWTLIAEGVGRGALAVQIRRDLDPAEEQLLKGFLRILHRPAPWEALHEESEQSAKPVAGVSASGLVGRSSSLAHVMRLVERVAPTDVSVLLLGENGTGKELVARALHDRGARPDRPFVAVNCASIPAALLESELFGHEKGAFTSAHARRAGRFEEAADGTLLLDEIGEMPLEMQAKLLRVLQERTFTRVGGSDVLVCDARVIAATNRDLAAEVERGRFRMDLYYRINVVTIEIPPLRERKEDIAALVTHFLRKHAPDFGGRVPEISAEVLAQLEDWHWPGNVRELENVVMNALVFATSDVLRPEDLPPHILPDGGGASRDDWQRAIGHLLDAGELSAGNPLLPRLEAWVVHEIVRRTGNKTLAAKMLGITKPTVYDRLRRYEALYGPDRGVEGEGVG